MRNHANMWRMVNDVWDVWGDIDHLLSVCQKWYPYITPGTWPDCDMIPLGRISIRGERGEDRMTRLTKDEQYTLMTLFTIFRSPLMFGGDLPSCDDFTLSLLTNEAVLKMHRESVDTRMLYRELDKVAITSRHPQTGEVYLALFNTSDEKEISVGVELKELGIEGTAEITDLWTGQSLGKVSAKVEQKLSPHASVLYKITQ